MPNSLRPPVPVKNRRYIKLQAKPRAANGPEEDYPRVFPGKTIRKHMDNLWMLGGNICPRSARRPLSEKGCHRACRGICRSVSGFVQINRRQQPRRRLQCMTPIALTQLARAGGIGTYVGT